MAVPTREAEPSSASLGVEASAGSSVRSGRAEAVRRRSRRAERSIAMFRAISRLRSPIRSLHQAVSPIPPFSPSSQLRSVPPFPAPRRHFYPSSPPSALRARPFSSARHRRRGEDREDDDGGDGLFLLANRDPEHPPRLLVVQPRLRPDSLLGCKLSEALNLANSLEEQRDGFYEAEFADKEPPPHVVVQNPLARSMKAHADTYFGPGTVETVKAHIKGLESKDELDAVFVNAILSGIQQRNLERAWEKPVLDRVALIIEIFNAHAQTKEAKLQSELAALMYKKSRLVRIRGPGGRLAFGASGEAEVVSARGRGSGGRGFISGAGETELQLQRRRIQERRVHLLAQIEEVRRTRALQRSAPKRHGGLHGKGLATVAVVGYTNAGKSTLVSALSQSDLYSDDRLFATVDPRLRSVILPSGRKVLLSDTVGFISDLPVQLVEAFHATLEEVVEADLLMHVLDSSAKNLDEQRSAVLQVLQQIGVAEEKIQNMIEVWNKIDLVEGKNGEHGYLDDGHLDESFDWKDEHSDDNMTSELSYAEDIAEDELEVVDESLEEGNDANGGEESEDIHEELDTFPEDGDAPGQSLSEDETAFSPSSGELMDEEDEPISGHSSKEMLEDTDGQQKGFLEQCQSKETCHVKTSAILGVGLQELLFLIDDKLNAQKPLQTRSFEPFDRKWRPYRVEEEKAVEQ